MNPNLDDIIDFHIMRTRMHIAAVNYFAGLLGHDFSDHDADKFSEPIKTPYALLNFLPYHPLFQPTAEQVETWGWAQREHHKTASHHATSYSNISLMSDLRVTEMVCDWFSANNEQNHIRKQIEFESPLDFYRKSSAQRHNFTSHQNELILSTIDTLNYRMNINDFIKIWNGII